MDAWCDHEEIEKGAVVPASQVFELGRRWYTGRLDRDWQRRSPQEMQAVFQDVGLPSDFWQIGLFRSKQP